METQEVIYDELMPEDPKAYMKAAHGDSDLKIDTYKMRQLVHDRMMKQIGPEVFRKEVRNLKNAKNQTPISMGSSSDHFTPAGKLETINNIQD